MTKTLCVNWVVQFYSYSILIIRSQLSLTGNDLIEKFYFLKHFTHATCNLYWMKFTSDALLFTVTSFFIYKNEANEWEMWDRKQATSQCDVSGCDWISRSVSSSFRGVGFSFIFSWVLMGIVTTLFVVGGNMEKLVCEPLANRQLFKVLTQSVFFSLFSYLGQTFFWRVILYITDNTVSQC